MVRIPIVHKAINKKREKNKKTVVQGFVGRRNKTMLNVEVVANAKES